MLFVSNWASESVSVIDTETNKVIRTLHVRVDHMNRIVKA